jgi:hypothetical protein
MPFDATIVCSIGYCEVAFGLGLRRSNCIARRRNVLMKPTLARLGYVTDLLKLVSIYLRHYDSLQHRRLVTQIRKHTTLREALPKFRSQTSILHHRRVVARRRSEPGARPRSSRWWCFHAYRWQSRCWSDGIEQR